MPTKARSDLFAGRLRQLREAAGLTIYALAQRSGVDRGYIGELERGEKQPSLDIARKLASALGRGLECWD